MLTHRHDGVWSSVTMVECSWIQDVRWKVLLIVVRADLGRKGGGGRGIKIVVLDHGCCWYSIRVSLCLLGHDWHAVRIVCRWHCAWCCSTVCIWLLLRTTATEMPSSVADATIVISVA